MQLKDQTTFVEYPAPPEMYSLRGRFGADLAVWMALWDATWTPGQPIGLLKALKLLWNYTGLRATLIHRLSFHLAKKGVKVLPGILTRLNITLYGFDVPSGVDIGPGLYVPHPVGTVIMAEKIGANLSLISNVTIGMRNEWAFPTIGNNVFIGAGARVLGKLEVGDNVQIGANAVVIQDLPANCTAVGIPAKILPGNSDILGK